ncbi:HD domain-containing protein, partial [Candidatus Dojkabacteria bacterium]|nr:HD domain-containing protein [Candidatus Dojkabacteria bacterium]
VNLKEGGFENVMEHTMQLALVCWYIIEDQNLDLDTEKVLKYCLVHDLVEVYSGDTDPYLSDKEYKESQSSREATALERIEREFPGLEKSILQMIKDYESQIDPEAGFVCGIDGLVPSMTLFTEESTYYQDNKIPARKFEDWNMGKAKNSKFAQQLLKNLKDYYQEQRNFFYKEN